MKTALIVIGVIALFILLAVLGWTTWFASRAADVVQHEVDPVLLQQKYEWFKNTAAALDAKRASLDTYKTKMDRFRKLEESDRLDRTNREQLMIWEQEQQGIKMSYNDLAADYNAQMAKWNWRFCNRGTLPQGATQVLPRDYREYIGE